MGHKTDKVIKRNTEPQYVKQVPCPTCQKLTKLECAHVECANRRILTASHQGVSYLPCSGKTTRARIPEFE